MKKQLKKLLPRTLFGRSLLILVTPILLIQVVTTFVFFERHWGKMTSRLAFAVAGEIKIVIDRIEQGASSEEIEVISGHLARSLDLLISFEAEQTLEQLDIPQSKSSVAKTLSIAFDKQIRKPYRIDTDKREKWVEIAIELDEGLLRISSPQRRLFSSSGYIFLYWMFGISLTLLLIAILFMRNQIRPIRRLSIAAERFGKGRGVPARFKPEGAKEVRQAAQAFLDMHERIKRQVEQRTAMLAGVSHDLRTPLTRMKLQAAMLGDSPDVDALKMDIEDMERMIEAYLAFVRGEGEEEPEFIDLKDLLNRIVLNAKRQGVDVEMVCEGDLSLLARPGAMERCLNNIISNARKYANNKVWLSAANLGEFIEIAIDDNGKGVPEEKFDDVFKPFYREEPSRNPATGGIGLGLPIAQDIVHSHGGEIWLEKSSKGGLKVIIKLPL
jgi:two-component system osmolarity sensor histidine kinase EnvZ